MSSPSDDEVADPSPGATGGNPISRISRRVRTLIVSGLLFFVLLLLAMTLPVPYVILQPGPTYNTLATYSDNGNQREIIGIDGRKPNKTSGNLNMTTVSYTDGKVTVFNALSAWLQSDEVVVPRSALYPPGQTTSQVDQENTAEFSESQDSAIAAAGCQLGYPAKFGVASVVRRATAKVLQPGDLLNTLDGKPANSQQALLALLTAEQPGAKVTLGITRAGKAENVSVTLAKPLQGRKGASLGIEVGSVCQMPFTVDLGLGNEIGGPSAGLMFALGIMDKVGKIDLTKGRFIAGTGEITSSGQVEAIGGIALKMIAARNAGATVFLAPASNCNDVLGNIPSGLDVIKVSSLKGAVQDLQDSAAGKAVPHC